MNKTLYRFAYRTFDLSERKANVQLKRYQHFHRSIATSLDWLSNICIKRFPPADNKTLASQCLLMLVCSRMVVDYLSASHIVLDDVECMFVICRFRTFLFFRLFFCLSLNRNCCDKCENRLAWSSISQWKIVDIALCYPIPASEVVVARTIPHKYSFIKLDIANDTSRNRKNPIFNQWKWKISFS